MTYLEMVNNILRRLRERTVATVNANSYSTLIGILVNDAKKEVEDAWQWAGLRTTLTATTTSGTFAYVLAGSGHRPTVLNVINDTDNWKMEYRTPEWFTEQYLLKDTVETGSPEYYTFNGLGDNDDTIIEFYPKPDDTYTVRINLVLRTGDLENDDDDIFVPYRPIMHLAYAKAIEERGEDAGVGSSSAYATAQRALADAISMDAAKHPEQTIWKVRYWLSSYRQPV